MISKPYQIVCVSCLILLQRDFSLASTNEKKIKRNKVIQESVPFEWSNLNDAEPGFDLSADEMAKFNIWPSGLIPYYIDGFSFDSVLRTRLRSYLAEVAAVTGVEFEEMLVPPQDTGYRYVFFVNRKGQLGCVDYASKDFTNHGVQKVVLGYDCVSGTLGALILALLGVPPQHNSPDRDDYIEIHEDNILPDKRSLFQKLNNDEWLFHNIDYDIASAGHYDSHKYSKNGAATIVMIKNSPGYSLEDRNGLTYTDLWKIRMLYNRIIKKKDFTQKNGTAILCSKLYKPGKKLNNFKPRKDRTAKGEYRQKPFQYTDNYQSSRSGFFIPQYDKIKRLLKGRNHQGIPFHFRTSSADDDLHDLPDFISDSDRKK